MSELQKPSRDKVFTLKELKEDTEEYCHKWYAARWGVPFDLSLSGLDYRGRLADWEKVSENERRAYQVLANLKTAIKEALTESSWAKSHPYVGFHAQALKEVEPHLLEAEKAMSFTWGTKVPVVEPTRREWLTLVVEPRIGSSIEIEDLARYSILAGFWPATVPGERLPIALGISVTRALSEEKRNIRAAVADNAEAQRCALAELDAMSPEALAPFGFNLKPSDSKT